MERLLLNAWGHRGWLAGCLWPLSQIYRLLWAIRQAGFRWGWIGSQRLAVPVVVVGNVVAGGAGKTPLVLALAQHLVSVGWKPGIVSRGYGRHTASVLEVQPESAPAAVGDEALLLRQRSACPTFVGVNRAQAGRTLLQLHPEVNVLLCDDGLQHSALQRDIEICVFDERGLGNGWLLPAGPLREPWPRQVDFVVAPSCAILGCASYEVTRRLSPHARRSCGELVELAQLRHAAVVAVAGIAQPERFFSMLEGIGLSLTRRLPMPDHHDFARDELTLASGEVLLCTEKDAVKLWQFHPQALAVPLLLDLPTDFLQALGERLPQPRPTPL